MVKRYKFLIVTLLAFLTFSLNAFAKEMKLEELSKEIENINPSAQSAYIIGKYVFTSEHELTTQDIMLAARSIDVKDKLGGTENDSIYGEMTIHEIIKVYNPKSHKSLGWIASSNTDGETVLDAKTNLSIQYIDYERLEEATEFDVTTDIALAEYKNTLAGYKFDEKFQSKPSEKLYSKDLALAKDGKLTGLVRMNSKVDNKVFPDETRTGFYVPIVITVPNANNETTVKIKNWWGEKTIKYSEFEHKDTKESGTVVLIALNKNEDSKETTIIVDLDGDNQVYGEKKYTIDWSNLVFESSLYETIKKDAKSDTNVNFQKVPSETNGQGVLTINSTIASQFPIYYYRGKVDNNVIFNNICWQIVRTTDTGSIKLIYNGLPNNGKCNNEGESSVVTNITDNKHSFSTGSGYPTFVGYTVPTIDQFKIKTNAGIAFARASVFDSMRYAKDVEYSNGVYHLKDSVEIDKSLFGTSDNPQIGQKYTYRWLEDNEINTKEFEITTGNIEDARNKLMENRYTCIPSSNAYVKDGVTTCEKVAYIVYASDTYTSGVGQQKTGVIGYIEFQGGIKFNSKIIEDFNSHEKAVKSQIKINNDNFYASYIENTPKAEALIDKTAKYCNSRSINDGGYYSTDHSKSTLLETKTKTRNSTNIKYSILYKNFSNLLDGNNPTLECDENDTYSTILGDEFYYPIGLLSADEANYAGVVFNANDSSESNTYLNTGAAYWLMTPAYVNGTNAYMLTISALGRFNTTISTMAVQTYLKPVIALKGSATYSEGNGTVEHPYVIVQ